MAADQTKFSTEQEQENDEALQVLTSEDDLEEGADDMEQDCD